MALSDVRFYPLLPLGLNRVRKLLAHRIVDTHVAC
jgi:hypothetical protein